MPRNIGTVIQSRLATLHELQTVYGLADLYDFLEVIAVDVCNDRRMKQGARHV